MVKFEDVTYYYPETADPALRNLNLSIGPGEAVCVMGANGSGKSTLACILAGLVRPTRGRVMVEGNDVSDRDQPREVGILFQNPDNQMVAVQVEKEIAFALENQACPQQLMEETVTAALEAFGIVHLRERLTSELSGGEKQLVALASVMVQNPPVLVLDEPDSYLDEPGKKKLERQLSRLRADNPNLVELRITQYPQVARRYPRLIILDRGKIVADSAPSEIFSQTELCLKTGIRHDRRLFGSVTADIPLPENRRSGEKKPDLLMVNSLTFGYFKKPIIENLELNLARGEVVGVIGPTGAGKSTLGLLCCGLLPPREGTIEFYRDGDLMADKPQPGWVSGVFQQPERQFFLSRCAEEISFGPRNFGFELTPVEVDGFFKMAGLEAARFSSRDPFSLSVGEKRRLAFAVVLATYAPFVVFDEPTSALDQEGVGRFIAMARELKNRGVGLMIISHDGDIIRELSERVLYLPGDGSGSILATAELYKSEWHSEIISSPAFDED
jgi:energy-coupling factor transporter ATP-binding protein EcfA2